MKKPHPRVEYTITSGRGEIPVAFKRCRLPRRTTRMLSSAQHTRTPPAVTALWGRPEARLPWRTSVFHAPCECLGAGSQRRAENASRTRVPPVACGGGATPPRVLRDASSEVGDMLGKRAVRGTTDSGMSRRRAANIHVTRPYGGSVGHPPWAVGQGARRPHTKRPLQGGVG